MQRIVIFHAEGPDYQQYKRFLNAEGPNFYQGRRDLQKDLTFSEAEGRQKTSEGQSEHKPTLSGSKLITQGYQAKSVRIYSFMF